MSRRYDVIVIGSGPGGEGAAMKAVKEGRRVAMVDRIQRVGGSATHLGTIPSKALRHSIQQVIETDQFSGSGYQALLASASRVIDDQVSVRQGNYDRNTVDVFHGRARLFSSDTVQIELEDGGSETLEGTGIVIATGSRPYHPPDVDFSHPRILDSDSVLGVADNPRSLTIYGAGVVGCEYASIFRGLRVKVSLINSRNRLLAFLDDEIVDALAYHLREKGALIHHNEEYERVEPDEGGVRLYLKSNKQVYSDYLLWAQGRTGNSNEMGLEDLGIKIDGRGNIEVNDMYQTAQPNIYAVGDVVGYPSLASAAYDEGRFAATHLVTGTCEQRLVEDIPTGIYTIPEISSVGLTERELTNRKVPYEVGRAFFKHLARAQITGRTTGVLKILFHRETLEILGIHCFGHDASEIIHIGQAIMAQPSTGNTLLYFINTTFNYPTMAEAYRVAALNGHNRLR